MTTPADQVYAGTLADFADSMAEEIELAYNQLRIANGFSALPAANVRERRMLFIAIARGVITHLQKHEQAFQIPISCAGITTTPDINVR